MKSRIGTVMMFYLRFFVLLMFALGTLFGGPVGARPVGASGGVLDSDPHMSGPRDMNYDHLIVPGSRIGPVSLGGSVQQALQHLGEPDAVNRWTGAGEKEVTYGYNDDCVWFTWVDSGVVPLVESGFRGINVSCDRWATADGLHVGSSMQDVVAHLGSYCATTSGGRLLVTSDTGIWFWAKDRNSPVTEISVEPPANQKWYGMCT